MTQESNLTKRGSMWGLRLTVPKKLRDLRALSGSPNTQKEVWRSTGKSDLSEARIELSRLKLELLSLFKSETHYLEDHVARTSIPRVAPTRAQMEGIAFGFKGSMAAEMFQERLDLPSQSELDATLGAAYVSLKEAKAHPDSDGWLPKQWDVLLATHADPRGWLLERREALLNQLRDSLDRGNYHLVDWAIASAAEQNHWDLPSHGGAYKYLGHLFTRAWIQELESSERNYLDGVSAVPTTNIFPIGPRVTLPTSGERAAATNRPISSYLDRYLDEQHRGENRATELQRRAAIRTLIEVCSDKAPHLYTKQDVLRFKEVVRALPPNAARRFKGKTALDIKGLSLDRTASQSVKTTNDKLSKLAVFGSWLADNVDGVDASTFRTSSFKAVRGDKTKVLPFSESQIAAIFNSRPFTGCESERNQLVPGSYRVRDWRFWIPLIAAYSGARLNEIAQLEVADIFELDHIWVMKVSDEGENQAVKTKKSSRVIPLHSTLIDLGFLGVVERAKSGGHVALFHHIGLDGDRRRSTHPGRTFRKLLVRLGIKVASERGGIHRLRHSVADRLREAGFADHDFAPLFGHDTQLAPMTAGYGAVEQLTLLRRKEMIDSIAYRELDLTLLRE